MGQFNFECSKCGRHEQFDWTDAVVVGLRCNGTHGSEIIHVKGHYGSYGDVYIDLTHGKPAEYDVDGNLTSAADAEPSGSIAVYHKQFEGLFDFWERLQAQGAIHPHPHVAAETIYCFGGYCTTEYRPKPKAQSSTRRGRAKDEDDDAWLLTQGDSGSGVIRVTFLLVSECGNQMPEPGFILFLS